MASTTFLQTIDLTKDYGNHKGAIDIDLNLKSGEIVGFIGPNGAGKSTTIRMITGFTKPQKGKVKLFDQEINHLDDYKKIYSRVGFMSSEPYFYENMTSRKLFNYSQSLLKKDISQKTADLVKIFDLELNKKIKDLSLGNRKKVGIVNAIAHDPDLVILDEPTSGLDPLNQQKFQNLMLEIKARGGCVFLSSHELQEVQEICDRIIMIKDAKIILEDKTANIIAKAPKKIIFSHKKYNEMKKELDEIKDIQEVKTFDGTVALYTQNVEPIVKLFVENNFYEFYLEKVSIEEMFMKNYE